MIIYSDNIITNIESFCRTSNQKACELIKIKPFISKKINQNGNDELMEQYKNAISGYVDQFSYALEMCDKVISGSYNYEITNTFKIIRESLLKHYRHIKDLSLEIY